MARRVQLRLSAAAVSGVPKPFFENMKGVTNVVSGYAGGKNANPTYKQVCTGETTRGSCPDSNTNPDQVTFDELLGGLLENPRPDHTQQTGCDEGTQYRSVIFYHDENQKKSREAYKAKLDDRAHSHQKNSPNQSSATFYTAEDYHQDYYQNNPGAGYCMAVVRPKVRSSKKFSKTS